MTLKEVGLYLRYEDESGELTRNALQACKRWLSDRGIRPSLNRKLYRRVLIETAIERSERSRRGNFGRKAGSTPAQLAAWARNMEKAHEANRQRGRERREARAKPTEE